MKKLLVLSCICLLILGLTSTVFALTQEEENEILKRRQEWLTKVFLVSEEAIQGAVSSIEDESGVILHYPDEPTDIFFAAGKTANWLAVELGVDINEINYVGYEDLDATITVGGLAAHTAGAHRYAFKFTLKEKPDKEYVVVAAYDYPDSKRWIKIGNILTSETMTTPAFPVTPPQDWGPGDDIIPRQDYEIRKRIDDSEVEIIAPYPGWKPEHNIRSGGGIEKCGDWRIIIKVDPETGLMYEEFDFFVDPKKPEGDEMVLPINRFAPIPIGFTDPVKSPIEGIRGLIPPIPEEREFPSDIPPFDKYNPVGPPVPAESHLPGIGRPVPGITVIGVMQIDDTVTISTPGALTIADGAISCDGDLSILGYGTITVKGDLNISASGTLYISPDVKIVCSGELLIEVLQLESGSPIQQIDQRLIEELDQQRLISIGRNNRFGGGATIRVDYTFTSEMADQDALRDAQE